VIIEHNGISSIKMIGNAIYEIRVRKTKARTRIKQQQESKKNKESGRKYKNKR
jgi:hypothetical protein